MEVKRYDTLPNEAKDIRTIVFINEQGFKDEFDDLDYHINHLVMFEANKPVGTCRFYFNKEKNVWIFGRLAVIKEYRGKHLGEKLLNRAEKYIREAGGGEIWLHAQTYAEEFYAKYGYKVCSSIEYEEHCPHIWMKKCIYKIRKMDINDTKEVLSMMKNFYSSEAVATNGSIEIFKRDIEECTQVNPYLEGYIFEINNEIIGYSMIARSFSTEFGKPCIWFEDLFLKQEFRGQHIIPEFISYISELNPDAVLKLEVENENTHAVHVYKKSGFKVLPYIEMTKSEI